MIAQQEHPQVPGQMELPPEAYTVGDRDGATYDEGFDYERLNAQSRRVFQVMRDGLWRTLRQIEDETGDPQASISARLRDFRKPRFGGLTVERRRIEGTFYYRLVVQA